MRKILAMVRQDALTRASYRFQALTSLLAVFAMLLPLYYVAQALDPMMKRSIRDQAPQYFAFVLIGVILLRFCYAIVYTLPGVFTAAIRSGTLEAMFATPTTLRALVAGMTGFTLLWAGAEATIMLGTGTLLGARIVVSHVLPALLVLALVLLAHLGFALLGVALVLAFRTTGPLLGGVMVTTNLLGGVYYPTHVVPTWVRDVSTVLPMTYGLRALRRTLLEGAPFGVISSDVIVLATMTVVFLPVSWALLRAALSYARRTGTLAQY